MQIKTNETEVISEFKKRKSRQIYVSILIVILVAPILILEYMGQSELFQIPLSVFISFMVAGTVAVLLFSLKNWRCPACGKYLGKSGLGIKFCKSCGVKLAE